jgi:RsiW-degrading membrane proteinase PrsW (M82 family)
MAPFVLDRTHSDLSSPDSGAVIGVVAAFGFSVLGMIVYLLYTGADSSHGHSPAAVPTEPAEPAVAH